MFSFAKSISAVLLLAAAVPQALAGQMFAYNGCDFEIWCAGAKNDNTFSETVRVRPGEKYLSPKPALNDNIGTVVKCSLNPSLYPVYQLEVAVSERRSWMDLSSIDGTPFQQYHRHAEIDGTACIIDCPPGTSECEWPFGVDCLSEGDVIMSLCQKI
ncbi:hypothetical protein F4777DRAFT_578493 [Nemania sp. FL0916]|nr:hypothetical protein F4777DRAFT_578493 [Nemania sp. FL0916]